MNRESFLEISLPEGWIATMNCPPDPLPNPKPPPPTQPPRWSFEELAQGANEVVIDYQGQHYRLRLTKNGRLVLNK